MARAAVSGRLGARLTWRPATLVGHRDETSAARTLVLEVPGWPGHIAGQHVDLRVTADDGYTAVRSYSLAAPADRERIELTVQRVPDGEVSGYLTQTLATGDAVEIRGPAGGWFVWAPGESAPVLLIAGGAGVVPLMAMIRARFEAGSRVPFRLIYSVRNPADVFYARELRRLASGGGFEVAYVYTRSAPTGFARPPGRLAAADVAAAGWLPALEPSCFVCGPTGFVERAADLLVDLGHDARRVKTERFGPSGA